MVPCQLAVLQPRPICRYRERLCLSNRLQGFPSPEAHRQQKRLTLTSSTSQLARPYVEAGSSPSPALAYQRTASRRRLDAHDALANWSLRSLEDQLQRQTCGCARVRELQFLVGNRRDDPALIGRSDEIRNRARLDVEVSGLRAFVQRVSPGVGNHARRNGHSFLG